MVHTGDHGVTEAQLRRTRRNFISRAGLRAAIAAVVNETLRHRDERWWAPAPPARRTRRSSARGSRT
jgi:TnpA family transposase